MDESTYWDQLRWIIMRGLSQLPDKSVSNYWCDWIEPKRYALGELEPRIEGQIGFLPGGRGMEVWAFSLTLPSGNVQMSDIVWNELTPSEHDFSWLSVDDAEKIIEIWISRNA